MRSFKRLPLLPACRPDPWHSPAPLVPGRLGTTPSQVPSSRGASNGPGHLLPPWDQPIRMVWSNDPRPFTPSREGPVGKRAVSPDRLLLSIVWGRAGGVPQRLGLMDKAGRSEHKAGAHSSRKSRPWGADPPQDQLGSGRNSTDFKVGSLPREPKISRLPRK